MNDRFGISRIFLFLLVGLLVAACTPTTTQVATPMPLEPTPTYTATAMATSIPLPEPPATLEPTPTATLEPTAVPAEMASYILTFDATWSAETHPSAYPPNPHFSGLIGALHHEDSRVWAEGELSSPGIKTMAETGGKTPLDTEIEALITAGEACELLSGGGIATSPGAVELKFTAHRDCALLSLVSMIAPSPDWFVGVSGLPLFDGGAWVEELVVDLYAYDAGTDSGSAYTSPNAPSDPAQGIFLIAEGALLEGGEIPLGVFRLTRLHE